MGKHLCWSLFLIKLRTVGLQLYQKGTPAQVIFAKYFQNSTKSHAQNAEHEDLYIHVQSHSLGGDLYMECS